MRLDPAQARDRFGAARVARLATVGADLRPHLVPVVFALAGDTVLTAVDAKPKTTTRLRRLANVAVHPRVALLADEYAEDWARLWWVRADGEAAVIESGAELDQALAALAARYPQYRSSPPAGPALVVRVSRWAGWSAS